MLELSISFTLLVKGTRMRDVKMKWHIDLTKLVIHDKLVCKKTRWVEEYYTINGEYHNPNGPAYRSWHINGQLCSEQYYLNGINYSEMHFHNVLQTLTKPHESYRVYP